MIKHSLMNGFGNSSILFSTAIGCVLFLPGFNQPACSQDAPAKMPQLQMCVPLGVVPGELTKIKARGLNLDTATEVKSNLPEATVKFLSAGKTGVPASLNAQQAGDTQVEFELTVAAEAVVDVVELTFVTPDGSAIYPFPVKTAERPLLEAEPNPGFKNAQAIELSRSVIGQIQSPQDVDVFAIDLTEGAFVRIAISAAAHGSAFDSLLTLYDVDGTQLATHDDHIPSRDSAIEWTVTKSGRYFVAVQDANDLGGEAQPYRLRVEPAQVPISFVSQVAPILQQHCVACHGPRKAEGGYRLDSFERLTSIGDSGQRGFVAHAIDSSESFRRITSSETGERMPLKSEPLSAEQIAILNTWIDEGLRFDGSSATASLLSQIPPITHPPAPTHYTASLPITAMAFSLDGKELLVGGYNEIIVWNPADGQLVRRIGNLPERIYRITFHPTLDLIAVAGGNPGQLGEVRLINSKGELQRVLGLSDDVAHDVAFSPDGNRVAVAVESAIRVFELATGEQQREITSHLDWVLAVAWSPDGSKLASASRDKTAKVFDLASGQSLASYSRHDAAVRGVMFHPSGEEVYTSGANSRWDRWKIEEAKQVRDMGLGGEGFGLFHFGSYFAVPSANNRVHLMKAAESERVREFQSSTSMRFITVTAHEASDRVVGGTQAGTVVVWELSTGKQLISFSGAPLAGSSQL